MAQYLYDPNTQNNLIVDYKCGTNFPMINSTNHMLLISKNKVTNLVINTKGMPH